MRGKEKESSSSAFAFTLIVGFFLFDPVPPLANLVVSCSYGRLLLVAAKHMLKKDSALSPQRRHILPHLVTLGIGTGGSRFSPRDWRSLGRRGRFPESRHVVLWFRKAYFPVSNCFQFGFQLIQSIYNFNSRKKREYMLCLARAVLHLYLLRMFTTKAARNLIQSGHTIDSSLFSLLLLPASSASSSSTAGSLSSLFLSLSSLRRSFSSLDRSRSALDRRSRSSLFFLGGGTGRSSGTDLTGTGAASSLGLLGDCEVLLRDEEGLLKEAETLLRASEGLRRAALSVLVLP